MAKARVKQLPLTKAADAEARIQNKLVGNQADRGKTELAKLREAIKVQARSSSGKKTKAVLNQIKKQYGDAELQRAIREFNITFRGIERDPHEGPRPPTKTLPASGPKGR
jgi:CRISPR/Cas system-associated protein Cas10 (large subunit of type III CRISPR-Cas system)